jgi:hypothetical protein
MQRSSLQSLRRVSLGIAIDIRKGVLQYQDQAMGTNQRIAQACCAIEAKDEREAAGGV